MKRLLVLTAIVEAITGAALIAAPDFVVRFLLGAEIAGPAFPLGRLAGVALLTLGIACWLARDEFAPRAIATAMLVYNLGAVAVLGSAGFQFPTAGPLLWLVVIFHAGMAYGCWTIVSRAPVGAAPR